VVRSTAIVVRWSGVLINRWCWLIPPPLLPPRTPTRTQTTDIQQSHAPPLSRGMWALALVLDGGIWGQEHQDPGSGRPSRCVTDTNHDFVMVNFYFSRTETPQPRPIETKPSPLLGRIANNGPSGGVGTAKTNPSPRWIGRPRTTTQAQRRGRNRTTMMRAQRRDRKPREGWTQPTAGYGRQRRQQQPRGRVWTRTNPSPPLGPMPRTTMQAQRKGYDTHEDDTQSTAGYGRQRRRHEPNGRLGATRGRNPAHRCWVCNINDGVPAGGCNDKSEWRARWAHRRHVEWHEGRGSPTPRPATTRTHRGGVPSTDMSFDTMAQETNTMMRTFKFLYLVWCT